MRFELPSLLVLLLAAALGGCSSGAEAPPRDAAVEASASDAAPPSDAAAPDDADTGDAAAPTMDAATPGAAAATGLALSGAGAYGQSANYQIDGPWGGRRRQPDELLPDVPNDVGRRRRHARQMRRVFG